MRRRLSASIIAILIGATLAWLGFAYVIPATELGASWGQIRRVSLDDPVPSPVPSLQGSESTRHSTGQTPPAAVSQMASATTGESIERVLLVGSDSRDDTEAASQFGSFAGQRADVIMVATLHRGGVTLLSIPRDLAVENLCRGGVHRIGEAFEGCDQVNGLTLLTTEVERLLDAEIDHAVAIDMVGFQRTIDAIGGYRICTDYALRDSKSGLDLEPGCHMADGETTLAWIRSRHTQRRVEGQWEPVPAVSDLARMERERRFLVDMLQRVGEDVGLDDLLDLAGEMAPYVTVDDELSLSDAAKLVWQLREDEVRTIEIPVIDDRLDTGAAILVPTTDPSELVGDL